MEITRQGNSIIELVIVIGLTSLLALSMSAIMLTTITSHTRIQNLTLIKQAGDHTLTTIQNLIRNAKDIDSCSISDNQSIVINNQDGYSTTFLTEIDPTNNALRLASNSGVYLTPNNLNVSDFNVVCSPDDNHPTLVKIQFNLYLYNPISQINTDLFQHFETTVAIRNN